jgi:hypothetical protein
VRELFVQGSLLAGADESNARAMHHAFSDIQVTIDDLIAEADKVAVRITFTATHSGPFLGYPATGKQAILTASSVPFSSSSSLAVIRLTLARPLIMRVSISACRPWKSILNRCASANARLIRTLRALLSSLSRLLCPSMRLTAQMRWLREPTISQRNNR